MSKIEGKVDPEKFSKSKFLEFFLSQFLVFVVVLVCADRDVINFVI